MTKKHWYDQAPAVEIPTPPRAGYGLRIGAQPPPAAALEELQELFAGGDWIARALAVRVCKKHHISASAALDYLRVAESDHGYWMCRPDENTPILPPDEQAVLQGLPPRSSLPEDLSEQLRALRPEPVAS